MSIADFFSMGGYGVYVWTSFGIAALLMIAELVTLRGRRRATVRRLRRLQRAQRQS